MFETSPRTLKLLAALVWYIGIVVLILKSGRLFIEADQINPDELSTGLVILAGLLVGTVKAKYLFGRLCIKNLKRIESLEQPKIWQFYRIHFFIFLFAMITLGGYLSRLAHGDYTMLLTVAAIELSIATALLGSSHIFWREQH
ncbi:MAG: hypothetical protein OQK78_12525 [Gammaproteobacteria bacterium]|nr:hypothetical protein [Gammaproteobacteria bacterium]